MRFVPWLITSFPFLVQILKFQDELKHDTDELENLWMKPSCGHYTEIAVWFYNIFVK